MKLTLNQQDEPLSVAGLRRFGLILAAAVAGIFGVAGPLLLGHAPPMWPWVGAVTLAAWAILAPATLRGLHFWWMRLGGALGWVNSRIILSVVFFGLFTPVSLFFRLVGRDSLTRRFDRTVASYRRPSVRAPAARMERPF